VGRDHCSPLMLKDKKRAGHRGPKRRQSVFRAELNKKWETVHERMVRQICADHGLVLEDHMVYDEHIPWEKTWNALKENNFYMKSRSICDVQGEVEAEYVKTNSVVKLEG